MGDEICREKPGILVGKISIMMQLNHLPFIDRFNRVTLKISATKTEESLLFYSAELKFFVSAKDLFLLYIPINARRLLVYPLD